ncbi:hypothetical protein SAMIE_1023350 [Sphingobium amiense]|uniref:Uncharacterized protein n=1 Tax=Sphingobium amiense TaxID=135719 RepID=A0A494W2I1_9SPHN|nr:hypothetical protein [Sphingobium amiense]BBD98834.1 hypothetical protein SAMIE_1023350 [Sphingobium amiense]
MIATTTPPVATPLLPAGTPVRLMVLKEINSRTARLGDRFKLRVDEPIYIDGASAVPVGSTAWGEIASVEKNGAVGKGGRLGAKLLYLDLPSGRVPLRGGYADKGDGNGAGVVLAVVGFGILGLLTGGDSARLKAGDSFTGYVDVTPPPAAPPSVVAIPSAPLQASAAIAD